MKTITIPPKLKILLDDLKSTRREYDYKRYIKSLLQIYYSLVTQHNYHNKDGVNNYFDVPATYLKSQVSHYNKYINNLIEYNIIKFYSKKEKPSLNIEDLYDNSMKKKKYYHVKMSKCIRYKFLIDINEGEDIEVDIENNNKTNNKTNNYIDITKKSLQSLNLNDEIKVDRFSGRLHSILTRKMDLDMGDETIINSYKQFFKTQDETYYNIDAIMCQPTLLLDYLIENKINIDSDYQDKVLDGTFYDYLVEKLEYINTRGEDEKDVLSDRSMAKKEFVKWVNGKWFESNEDLRKLFPQITNFMYYYKKDNSKSIGRYLQWKERKIFINDILENINEVTDFAVTIHDSIIVDDVKVYDYIQNKINKHLQNVKLKLKITNMKNQKEIDYSDPSTWEDASTKKEVKTDVKTKVLKTLSDDDFFNSNDKAPAVSSNSCKLAHNNAKPTPPTTTIPKEKETLKTKEIDWDNGWDFTNDLPGVGEK